MNKINFLIALALVLTWASCNHDEIMPTTLLKEWRGDVLIDSQPLSQTSAVYLAELRVSKDSIGYMIRTQLAGDITLTKNDTFQLSMLPNHKLQVLANNMQSDIGGIYDIQTLSIDSLTAIRSIQVLDVNGNLINKGSVQWIFGVK